MYSIKRFSQIGSLDTDSNSQFIKGRKYDTDLNRLGRGKQTLTNELSKNQLNTELRESMKPKNLEKYGNIQD